MVLIDNPYERYWSRYTEAKLQYAPTLKPDGNGATVLSGLNESRPWAKYILKTDTTEKQATLHQAFDAYRAWIREEYFDATKNDLTDYGFTKLGQVDTLQSRHADTPLPQLNSEQLTTMFRYWRQKPIRQKKSGELVRVSRASVKNYIGELKRFFYWLDRCKDFDWSKPNDFDHLDRFVKTVERASEIKTMRSGGSFTPPLSPLNFVIGILLIIFSPRTLRVLIISSNLIGSMKQIPCIASSSFLDMFRRCVTSRSVRASIGPCRAKVNGYEAAQYIRQQTWGARDAAGRIDRVGTGRRSRADAAVWIDHHLVKPAEPAAIQQLLFKHQSRKC